MVFKKKKIIGGKSTWKKLNKIEMFLKKLLLLSFSIRQLGTLCVLTVEGGLPYEARQKRQPEVLPTVLNPGHEESIKGGNKFFFVRHLLDPAIHKKSINLFGT